jgi:hypothetical protein
MKFGGKRYGAVPSHGNQTMSDEHGDEISCRNHNKNTTLTPSVLEEMSDAKSFAFVTSIQSSANHSIFLLSLYERST